MLGPNKKHFVDHVGTLNEGGMLPIMMVTVMPLHGDDDEYLMMSVVMTMV